ncbi:MAG: lipid-A-disaccharide synthase, partial [Cycloclasticus sp.]|nr:lipid-A-disaccharide synthase [Cycloclasticus sp.]
CSDQIPELNVLVPMPDQSTSDLFLRLYNESGIELDLAVQVLASTEMIAASDLVLVASGTATLEVMLLQKPMVVAYKLSPLTSWVFKTFNLLKAPFVSMPNLISGKAVVKELLQDEVTVDNLSTEVMALYRDKKARQTMIEEFGHMKTKLTCHADAQAARIVSRVIEGEMTV